MTLTPIKVAIVEPNPIVRLGLEAQVKKLAKYKVQVIHLEHSITNAWYDDPSLNLTVDLFILNPTLCGLQPKKHFSSQGNRGAKHVAFSYGMSSSELLKKYDGVINISDSLEQVTNLVDKLLGSKSKQDQQESQDLTNREKEIVVCVVKGLTNKAIAEELCLSTHTVITHRRNITKKLQIHSTSGLTIYAIMNKLIELDDLTSKKKKK